MTMPTHDENLDVMRGTPARLAGLVEGVSDDVLTRRPAPAAWAAREVLCHLRDTEDSFVARVFLALHNDNPRWLPAVDPERWAEDRQYLRSDGRLALAAFARRRAENLALLETLTPEQWARTGQHPTRGQMSVQDVAAFWAWHDGNHVEQITRALRGEP